MNKETRNLIVFFIATFMWTWAFYTPIVIGGHSPYEMPWMIFLILGGMGPSVVAVVMVLLMREREERRDFWRRCFSLRQIGRSWWLVILLTFPLLYGLSIAVDVALEGSLPGMELLGSLMAAPAAIPFALFIRFMSGPWSEEFGWRGYALDRIIRPLGAISGSIVLGVIWGVWHLPLFFMPATWHGQVGFAFSGFWTFILLSIALSLFMTWVYLNTGRSIFSGMMIHFTSNLSGQLLAPVSERVEVIRVLILLAMAIIVCMWMIKQQVPHSAAVQSSH